MKKYFLITVAVFAFVFSGCEKESTDSQTTSLKSLNIKDITVKDGMLCFDSWDQYESTLNSLAQACESYVSLYIDSVYETIKQQPKYIYPYENRLFSSHGVQYTELHLA